MPRGRTQRFKHGLHHDGADVCRAAQGGPEEWRAGDRDGVDRSIGGGSVHIASVPQGQGHRTVISQVIADIFGIAPGDVRVNTEVDTAKDAWSIASGNYASRFAAAVAGTAKIAADRLATRLARIAAAQLNIDASDVVFGKGRVGSGTNPDNAVSFSRLAALSHWSPGSLPDDVGHTIRETAFWTPPETDSP